MERRAFNKAFCGNCGKYGHLFKDCSEPVISIGIIGFKNCTVEKNIKLLAVMRRHSYAYVELVRAKYDKDNLEYIKDLVQGLTPEEQFFLISRSFNEIWEELWTVKEVGPFIKDREICCKNFEESLPQLRKIISEFEPFYQSPEWGFPKGRRNMNETDFTCALREFREETGLSIDEFDIIESFGTFSEVYKANNGVNYKHIYYIAEIKDGIVPTINKDDLHQVGEVGKLEFIEPIKLIQLLRFDDLERKKLILDVEYKIKKEKGLCY
jgi:8-oxo-dGTP pyrophosphatase MutT (NUDIX family)